MKALAGLVLLQGQQAACRRMSRHGSSCRMGERVVQRIRRRLVDADLPRAASAGGEVDLLASGRADAGGATGPVGVAQRALRAGPAGPLGIAACALARRVVLGPAVGDQLR